MATKHVPINVQRQPGSIFDSLREEAANRGMFETRTQESMDWFRRNIRKIRMNRRQLLRDESLVRRPRPRIGSMFMYFYDAKHKETLPYWDMFPLIIMVGPAKDGFYGLNMHYLSPLMRGRLFDLLTENMTNRNYDERTRIKISYDILNRTSRLRAFRPCFKHYLDEQVKRPLLRVEPSDWEVALFLPTERWDPLSVKNREVWRESRQMIINRGSG